MKDLFKIIKQTIVNKNTGLAEEKINIITGGVDLLVNGETLGLATHPVGSIYITTDETDNPITKFGGSWIQIKDVFLLGAGDIYENGANGGSADAVVVKHKHIPAARIDAFSDSLDYELTLANVNYGGLISYYQMETRQSNQGMRTSTGYEGEDGTGKNMPPYLVVYIWKRLAD